MTPELTVLTLAALLQMLQIILYGAAANAQVGYDYSAGARDEPRQLSGTAGRLQRALNNHFEGLLLFAIAALVIALADKSSGFTAACAWAYLAARALYIPAYALGWVPWRSVIWGIGFFATLAMLIAALL